LSLGLLAAGVLGWRRRELLDAVVLRWWRWFPGRTWQQCVRRALWLLQRRGSWAGRPRRASQTVQAWLRASLPHPAADAELGQLTRMAEWAAYAPDLAPPWEWAQVRGACGRALDGWTLRRWREAGPANTLGGAG
jgi:hypothetical protein